MWQSKVQIASMGFRIRQIRAAQRKNCERPNSCSEAASTRRESASRVSVTHEVSATSVAKFLYLHTQK